MSKTQIPTGGIADDAISEEHLDATAITGTTALAATPDDTDEVLISDGGTLKRIDFSHFKAANFASLISTTTVSSNTAAVDIALTGSFNTYLVSIDAFKAAGDNETFRVSASVDSGSNYNVTAYAGVKYVFSADESGSTGDFLTDHFASASTTPSLIEGLGSGSTEHSNLEMTFFSPTQASTGKMFGWRAIGYKSDNHYTHCDGVGRWDTSSAITHLRFTFNSENVAAGKFSLYGVNR